MQIFTTAQARRRFGEFINLVQRGPVRVMRRDQVVGVMVSAQDFEAMRAFYAHRLQRTLDQIGAAAMTCGLTHVDIERLLADER